MPVVYYGYPEKIDFPLQAAIMTSAQAVILPDALPFLEPLHPAPQTADEAARETLQDPPIRERATTTAWVVRQ